MDVSPRPAPADRPAARAPRPTTEVVLCTYNGAMFLEAQLASILAQTRLPDFISIRDDGSSDGTLEIARSHASRLRGQGPAIRVDVNAVRLGWAGNFARGIAEARGDILFPCDQDDRWSPRKIEACLALLEASGADLVFSDGLIIDAAGARVGRHSVLQTYGLRARQIAGFGKSPVRYLVRRNYINGAAMAIRREIAQAALPVPEGMPHDYWLAIWCAFHGGIVATPECLYEYRQHGGNAIGLGRRSDYYFWLSLWRRPGVPRERELRLLAAAVERIRMIPGGDIAPFLSKKHWMETCVTDPRPMKRLRAILLSLLRGKYRRFGAPHALARDVLAALRSLASLPGRRR